MGSSRGQAARRADACGAGVWPARQPPGAASMARPEGAGAAGARAVTPARAALSSGGDGQRDGVPRRAPHGA
eukprot:9494934-Pyramimonas_sp.AAC.1